MLLIRNKTIVGREVSRGSRDSSVDNTSKKCGNRWDIKRAVEMGEGKRDLEECVLRDGMCLEYVDMLVKRATREEVIPDTGDRRETPWAKIPEKVG